MLSSVARQLKEEFARNEAVCKNLIGLFQLIAHKGRFRIVCILSQGEFCVQEIADILGTDKLSNLSQQLKILRLAGVVTSRRDEKRMMYSLSDPRVAHMIEFFRAEFL